MKIKNGQNWFEKKYMFFLSTAFDTEFSGGSFYHNFNLLSEAQSPRAHARVSRIVQLLAVMEQLGEVVTIREMLMLVSYLITGGLNCEAVHKRKNKIGWQNEYAFYNLLFNTYNSKLELLFIYYFTN